MKVLITVSLVILLTFVYGLSGTSNNRNQYHYDVYRDDESNNKN